MRKRAEYQLKTITLFFILFFTGWTSLASSQETLVVGQVLNIDDKTPIPNVNIYFKNTSIGTTANEEGYFMLRTTGKETTLVFSCLGFRQKTIKLKQGQSVGIQVELAEISTELPDVFIVPGANPAIELLKKVRLMKSENNEWRINGYTSKRTEQNLILLSKIDQQSVNKRIYEQLGKGKLTDADSSLIIPLYMTENQYILSASGSKYLSENKFTTSTEAEKLVQSLLRDFQTQINFYDNAIILFGKGMISPLSNTGSAYYQYYLTDSIDSETGKKYHIDFISKNKKNLTFNGSMWIDSATLALTEIKAVLSKQANLNFIHNLTISQKYKPLAGNRWTLDSETTTLNMTYELMADSLHPRPEIFIKRNVTCLKNDSIITGNFAKSEYSTETLENKLSDLNETPLISAAKWIADIAITGYIPFGKIDIGKIQNLARFTEIEGLRLNIPFCTNQKMWKNYCLSGYVGYATRNKTIKYSGAAQVRLPWKGRNILGISYTNDYRSNNYKYTDFLVRENPLSSGDEDISGTIFGLRSAQNMSERREFCASLALDWNKDIESNIYLRGNEIRNSAEMPFISKGIAYDKIAYQSVILSTRFSWNERVYDDHFQRIYVSNYRPVVYSIVEGGRYNVGKKEGNFLWISGIIKQNIPFTIGEWDYMFEGGYILGTLPYALLEMPSGNVASGYSRYRFGLMNLMEYRADKYVMFHNELTLNGVVFNRIPLIKQLNLREMLTFKMYYGHLDYSHKETLDLPDYVHNMNIPYMEAGIGVTNLLKIFTLQSVWRLTELNNPLVTKWGLKGSIRLSL